jgi:hypothetical protein
MKTEHAEDPFLVTHAAKEAAKREASDSLTNGPLTEPARATAAKPAKLVATPNPAASAAAVPMPVASNSPMPVYNPPSSYMQHDNETPVYDPALSSKFSNEVER